MKRLQIKSCITFFIVILFLFGCSNNFQISDNSNKIVSSNSSNSMNPRYSNNNFVQENWRNQWKSEFDKTFALLEMNQKLWKEKQILNYDFVIAKYSGGHTNPWNREPVLIKVRDGEKVSIEPVEKDKEYVIYSKTDGFENFDTIDKLFDYLKLELEKGSMVGGEFNKILGFPQKITLTFSFEIHGYHNIVVEKLEKR